MLYDPETLAPFPDAAGNFTTALSEIEVVNRCRRSDSKMPVGALPIAWQQQRSSPAKTTMQQRRDDGQSGSAPTRPTRRQHWLVGLGVAAVVFVLLLRTAGTVGVTWDEPIYSQAAENAARWFGTLLRGGPGAAFEQTAFGVGWGLVNEHPPLVRVLNGLGWALTRGVLPAPTAHRVGSMALAAFTIGVLAAATARRSGIAAGLFAAAAVVTMPRVFFHAHLGASDFAHAATWFLATLAFYHATGSRRWWAPLLAGLGLGLALLTKINAVLLLPYWTIWLLIYRRNSRAWFVFLLSLPVALAVLIAGWPWIWGNPVAGLANWVKFFPCPFRDPPVVCRPALREDAVVSCPRHGGHHDAGGVAGAGLLGLFSKEGRPGSIADGTGGGDVSSSLSGTGCN